MRSLVTQTAGLLFSGILTAAGALTAQADYRSSADWFASKTEKERVVLQGMLILLGHYNGLIDGVFGKNTYQSIVSYERTQHLDGDGILNPAEEQELLAEAAVAYELLGFSDEIDERTGIKFPIPSALFATKSPSKWGTHWEAADGSIELETLAIPEIEATFETLFTRLSRSGDRTIDYTFLGEGVFVLSGRLEARKFYTALVRLEGTSSGFSISWSESKDEIASIVSVFLASMVQFPEASSFGREGGEADPEAIADFAGSGFAISSEGTIVTNAHVVEGCKAIEVVDLGSARVISSDPDRDLAVIQVSGRQLAAAARIQTRPLALGQTVIVVGYPLSVLMGNALTVSPGVVASLSGLGGNKASFAINANIQPGSSGAPVLDSGANVVGVAAGKLNEARLLQEVGTTGGNTGFAISAQTLLEFLGPFKSSTSSNEPAEELSTQAVVERAQEFTYQILCRS